MYIYIYIYIYTYIHIHTIINVYGIRDWTSNYLTVRARGPREWGRRGHAPGQRTWGGTTRGCVIALLLVCV